MFFQHNLLPNRKWWIDENKERNKKNKKIKKFNFKKDIARTKIFYIEIIILIN